MFKFYPHKRILNILLLFDDRQGQFALSIGTDYLQPVQATWPIVGVPGLAIEQSSLLDRPSAGILNAVTPGGFTFRSCPVDIELLPERIGHDI